jgi:ribonuclease-3
MPPTDRDKTLDELEQRLGHRFANRAFLEESLTHPSHTQAQPGPSNQRLEFLGDAVLQLIVSTALFDAFPEEREGVLSRRRSVLTKGVFLVKVALELGIDHALRLSPAEEAAGGRTRASTLEDAFEAVVGALYLDADLQTVRTNLLRWYGPLDVRLGGLEQHENPKGRLQELVQPIHGNDALHYELHRTKGAPHERSFDVHLHFIGRKIAEGQGSSKKEAEENAARAALANWPPA